MSSISIFAMDHICTGMAGLGYLLEHPNFILHLARRELQERGWKRKDSDYSWSQVPINRGRMRVVS